MADRERLSRRLLALTGLWFLASGLLLALSLVVVALVAFAVLLFVNLAIAGVWLLRRFPIREELRIAVDSIERTVRSLGSRLRKLGFRRHVRRVGSRTRNMAGGAPQRTHLLLVRVGQAYAVAAYWLAGVTSRIFHVGVLGRRRDALRLNERGAELRRRGDPHQAAEQHRVALAIVRDLGDQHAEALTLNNLALALAQEGADRAAVQHFEQALTVLRELGDEEYEGQVIANLGFVHRRQGRTEEAVTLLHEALDKLPPESSAYRQVEEQLRRAS